MRILNFFAAIAALLLLGACGSGGSTGGASSTPVQSSSSSSIESSSSESSEESSESSSSESSASSSSSESSQSSTGITSVEFSASMGVGWNLGNTLEAVGGETAWGNPKATPELMQAVKAAGFDNVRLPVAWSQFSDEPNFVIDPTWLARVEEVVTYALDAELMVMINMHWDGGWMQPTYAEQAYVNNRMEIMWQQIATHFSEFDQNLVFACTNEVMVEGDYGTPIEEYYTVQNGFNQICVDTVRATGGNNSERFLAVQGFNTNIDHTINFFELPDDSATDKLLVEVHYYDPFNFTLNGDSQITQWGAGATDAGATETWANESYVDTQFGRMKSKFVDNGIGVILGEYGAFHREGVDGHEIFRNAWNDYITQAALANQMVPMYWDNGFTGDTGFGLFNRTTAEQVYPDLIELITQ
ncbi:glycoside hydrolase family 5 protein [Gilvimarinus sp. SDUM040013]|uniref:Glycoside hydrolase family 5 protein n=1 Tax=Gilvimarinus gilvus TaxID=3058038 RepID=A0ABU4RYN9_9GAMM|nr:glycoside hydrolase family 5 protein [Gilvimarinus sp. SDUM040013]MDO3386360.1 glycoside hydrolase family 5 protein [Gilvimarinus sp. SDUM040013]MDX6849982.1 glycoside hydrolase family 5 protein [Gilvimarinus sp. SDUM040013]